MQYRKFNNLEKEVSAIGLGTWVMGGWLWGGAQDEESRAAIEASIAAGVNFIDTAPVYGFGRSEKIVGEVIEKLKVRDEVVIATKCGLEWNDKEQIRRNSTRERILKEIDESRTRLRTDVIDLYQVHWPDACTPFSETMETMFECLERGWVRAIGVSNFNVEQMQQCLEIAPIHSLQPSYNLFERGVEEEIIPFCRELGIDILSYGSICRGLLSGKFRKEVRFAKEDVRSMDPKFKGESLEEYLNAVSRMIPMAEEKKATLAQLASRWVADQPGVTIALVGARRANQATQNAGAYNFDLTEEERVRMETITEEEVKHPVSSAVGGPPERDTVTL